MKQHPATAFRKVGNRRVEFQRWLKGIIHHHIAFLLPVNRIKWESVHPLGSPAEWTSFSSRMQMILSTILAHGRFFDEAGVILPQRTSPHKRHPKATMGRSDVARLINQIYHLTKLFFLLPSPFLIISWPRLNACHRSIIITHSHIFAFSWEGAAEVLVPAAGNKLTLKV